MVRGSILLGYEVGSGNPVSIPANHMVVAGQTQMAGKTTTLEALIARSQLPAVAFVTKRGERSFLDGRRVEPYFRERADWQFVASVLEATMRERLRFERAWIIRASKGARTLADVQKNVRQLMAKAKGMSADVYLTLDSYLDIVVPRVESIEFADSLELSPGVNVLDLSARDTFPPELQSLVMRSVLEWIYENADGTITIIPEAWEFIPQGRGSPVKLAAIELIRKGAGLKNFVWLDSQDIGGMDKELLRSCPVWLLGVQRETNEIKRTLDNIPAGVARPKASEIATLEKGQFFACWGKHVVKTYVQPAWAGETECREIACGRLRVEFLRPPESVAGFKIRYPAVALKEKKPMPSETDKKLDMLIELMRNQQVAVAGVTPGDLPAASRSTPLLANPMATSSSEEELFQRFRAKLLADPVLLSVLTSKPELRIEVERHVVTMDGSSSDGRIAKLLAEGFFDSGKRNGEVRTELRRTGKDVAPPTISNVLGSLVEMGFLTRQSDRYAAVEGMKVNVVSKK